MKLFALKILTVSPTEELTEGAKYEGLVLERQWLLDFLNKSLVHLRSETVFEGRIDISHLVFIGKLSTDVFKDSEFER